MKMSKGLIEGQAFAVEFSLDVAQVFEKILAFCDEKFPDFKNDQLINCVKQMFK